jgi:uncharacterized protein YndB with AHSA1/START domain
MESASMTLFLLLLLAAISALVAYISLQPDAFRITRSGVVGAPVERIYPLINDLHQWEHWSPWAKLDPGQVVTYEGSPLGAGSIMTWAGNSKVGEGKMKISESSPNERIRLRLQFLKPMRAIHDMQIDLRPLGDSRTEVVWTMAGKNEFMAKAMHAFMNMERRIGDRFDQGLANIKALAEADA